MAFLANSVSGINLSDPIAVLPYVGEKYAKLLSKLEIKTVSDLLHHYPTRYENYSLISPIYRLQPGEKVTVIGEITEYKFQPTRKSGFTIQQATLIDKSGKIKLKWFNQSFLSSVIKPGTKIAVAGIVEKEGNFLVITNPEYEIIRASQGQSSPNGGLSLKQFLIHTGRLVPIYPETAGVSSRFIRGKTALLIGILNWYQKKFNLLPQIEDWLPDSIRKSENLIDLKDALLKIHFPKSQNDIDQAGERLGFDEILKIQLEALYRRRQWSKQGSALPIFNFQFSIFNFIKSLPFKLTNDQQNAIDDILKDLSRSTPMNRLLQGDVGAGKTVVAAAAAFAVIKAGFQAAFMAPTQVLADQHSATLTQLLSPFGIKISLLTGANYRLASRRSGLPITDYRLPDLLIGTHALIHKRATALIDKSRLALVIIDEQHRFGVEQRGKLIEQGSHPHVLSMTATPIPRTIALTSLADLDITIIKQVPVGRLPVKTWVVPEIKRENAYQWIKKQIKEEKSQVFVVCPLIEESEHESLKQIRAATVEFNKLKSRFNKLNLALLHGRMKARDKTNILLDMKNKKIDILVTTPVVEVGIDIPQATIIMIEAAQKFGLASLHQLRGRVGRSDVQSYCLLFVSFEKETKRLKALETIHNGLELSQLDLKWRGPGQLFATAQHGWPSLKIGDLNNLSQVRRAHQVAEKLIQSPDFFTKNKFLVAKTIAPN